MKKKSSSGKSGSLRTFIIYGLIVISVILIALSIRLFSIMRESKFDGQHRFTLAIAQQDKVFGLISFEPLTNSLSFLTFSGNSSIPISKLNKIIGIIPDGFINARYPLNLSNTIPSLMQSFIFHPDSQSENITIYDLFQFWFYANKIPQSTISIKKIPSTSANTIFDKYVALLFADSVLSSENTSIQIINASGESGLGGRLERVVTNLGGNVVSLKTASKIEKASLIQYFGSKSYTLKKINSLIPFHLKNLDKQSIAEIIIIIGKDNKDTRLF